MLYTIYLPWQVGEALPHWPVPPHVEEEEPIRLYPSAHANTTLVPKLYDVLDGWMVTCAFKLGLLHVIAEEYSDGI